MKKLMSFAAAVVSFSVAFGMLGSCVQAQQIGVTTPFTSVSDSYFETMESVLVFHCRVEEGLDHES